MMDEIKVEVMIKLCWFLHFFGDFWNDLLDWITCLEYLKGRNPAVTKNWKAGEKSAPMECHHHQKPLDSVSPRLFSLSNPMAKLPMDNPPNNHIRLHAQL